MVRLLNIERFWLLAPRGTAAMAATAPGFFMPSVRLGSLLSLANLPKVFSKEPHVAGSGKDGTDMPVEGVFRERTAGPASVKRSQACPSI
jgi:hypothetical protein